MSTAINRISASGVAAMLYPVMKPGRVAKVAGGDRTAATAAGAASQAAVPASSSRTQAADASNSTAEQLHAAFEYARAALGSAATASATSAQSGPDQGQSIGPQQAGGAAYAQSEQQASGQTLDLTA